MSNPLIRTGKSTVVDKSARYHKLGLNENPFPSEPTVLPDHPDPRRNGTIYCAKLHEDKREIFESLLISRTNGPPIRQLVFLMDHTTARGRGIGKTAFLNRRQNEILSDFGAQASGGDEVVFAIHIIPQVSPECRKFWEFSRLICERLVERNVVLQAVCRLRASFPGIDQNMLEEVGDIENWGNTIGDDSWLRERGVDTYEVKRHVKRRLDLAGVQNDVANKLATCGFQAEPMRDWMRNLKDSWWRREGNSLLFDDFVKFFVDAGFTRGLLLVDEVEKIVRPQNSTERRKFVESLRYFLIDGDCESARTGFYGTVLTIHPGVQELLLQHWKVAGLDRSAPLHEPDVKQNEISFGPLSREHATMLVLEYLNYYRVNASESDLAPFATDAIDSALVKSKNVPGPMLNLLFNTIEKAANSETTQIDGQFIEQIYDDRTPINDKLLVADPLPSAQTILHDEDDHNETPT